MIDRIKTIIYVACNLLTRLLQLPPLTLARVRTCHIRWFPALALALGSVSLHDGRLLDADALIAEFRQWLQPLSLRSREERGMPPPPDDIPSTSSEDSDVSDGFLASSDDEDTPIDGVLAWETQLAAFVDICGHGTRTALTEAAAMDMARYMAAF